MPSTHLPRAVPTGRGGSHRRVGIEFVNGVLTLPFGVERCGIPSGTIRPRVWTAASRAGHLVDGVVDDGLDEGMESGKAATAGDMSTAVHR